MSVLVLGAASWNLMIRLEALPEGPCTIFDGTELEAAGSTGTGKAMALAALGFSPRLHCVLGRDSRAEKIIAACAARGIEMLVDWQDGPSPHHLNLMDRAGGRISILLEQGPEVPIMDRDRLRAEIAAADVIFLSLCASLLQVLDLLAEARAEIHLDLHDYDGVTPWHDAFIAHADVIQLSDIALKDAASVLERMLGGRARQIVLTRAERGALIVTQDAQVEVPALPASITDSNGAGDAFSVALWAAQAEGYGLEQAGLIAAAAACFALEEESLFPPDIDLAQVKARAGLS